MIPLLLSCSAVVSLAGPDDADRLRFFEAKVRPLLIERCGDCHGADDPQGGLRLDDVAALVRGGDSGPVVVAGDLDASLLVAAVRYDGLEMPPGEPLTGAERSILERWVADGAVVPETTHGADRKSIDDGRWWAAEPLAPLDSDRSDAIDRLVGRRLSAAGLSPAPPADRITLIRRLSLDLTGLPPLPERIDAFVADERPDAYERLVDELLASPHHGERQARLWLDVVRYADSDGYRADGLRPDAWRYRQWVVDAFNDNLPYDRFVRMQVAGDRIAPGDPDAAAAVGFLRLGIYEYNQRDAEGQWETIVDEMTDVTADVFLATGLACAKCHDHKFDPIPRADYYRLRAALEPVCFADELAGDPATPNDPAALAAGFLRDAKLPADPFGSVAAEGLLAELAALEEPAFRKAGDKAVGLFPENVQAMYRKPPAERTSYEEQMAYLVHRQVLDALDNAGKVAGEIPKADRPRRDSLRKQLVHLGVRIPKPTAMHGHSVMTVRDWPGAVRPTRLPGRTNGRAFPAGAPQVYGGADFDAGDRRTALADWLTAPDNPVVARVIVNRVWQGHFGSGLVSSGNDFGRLGEPPSHPTLMDTLAADLIAGGWNLKVLHRRIVTSETYRQSSIHPDTEQCLKIDAGNRLLWQMPVRRLDAEQYRDALLMAIGKLDRGVGGPSIDGTGPRRSLYLRRMRNGGDEMLRTLDAPSGVVGAAKRDMTVTPTQALMMLNNGRFDSVARSLAERIRDDVGDDPTAFVRRGWRLTTGRQPSDDMVELLTPLAEAGADGRRDVCHVLLNNNAMLFVE